MEFSKEILLNTLHEKNQDRALKPFYDNFGPSIRSEYKLDGEDIVDLDWEISGIVITYVDDKMNQLRLGVNDDEGKSFSGWIGDGITEEIKAEHIIELYGPTQSFEYEKQGYKIGFEFENEQLRYITIAKV